MTTAPLIDVETLVQARAKDDAIDLSTPEGHTLLRALIDDELRRWDDDVRHGRRSVFITNPATLELLAWQNLVQ